MRLILEQLRVYSIIIVLTSDQQLKQGDKINF